MPRSDPRSTADLLRELIAKATKGPWTVLHHLDPENCYRDDTIFRFADHEPHDSCGGDRVVAHGGARIPGSIDPNLLLIVALASPDVAEKLADVLEPERRPNGSFCALCMVEYPAHDDDCTIGALDAAVRRGLEEGK